MPPKKNSLFAGKNIPYPAILTWLIGAGCFWAHPQTRFPNESQMPAPRLLPGQKEFVFSLYGIPGSVEGLESLIGFMRTSGLGNGFDPGPTAVASSEELIHVIAKNHWPLVCYPPDGGRMQVKGGTSLVRPEDETVLRLMDREGLFCGIQLGEWGYHFHQLTSDRNWWQAVLGPDYEGQIGSFFIPGENRGYPIKPRTRKECYEQLREYFYWHRQAKAGRVISVTGHSHYEAYAAEWGASVIGLEVGENIRFTQSKFAFARGAARQWNLPWSVQVSPWFGPSVTTRGELTRNGNIVTGLDAGHSFSLYRRMWLHAWFAGAAMVTPENSINNFFEREGAPWHLTSLGEMAAGTHRFMQDHDRGNPYTPMLVVLDHLAGYAPYHELTWGVLPKSEGDEEIHAFLENQLYHSDKRIPYPGSESNPESTYLNPTPYGEIADVMLNTATGAGMSRYPLIFLLGDMHFSRFFLFELGKAIESGCHLLLQQRHVHAMGQAVYEMLKSKGAVTLIHAPDRLGNGPRFPIDPNQLSDLTKVVLPIKINGDPIQFQINQTNGGWVVELINNDGVFKVGDKPTVVYEEAYAKIILEPQFEFKTAREWWTRESLAVSNDRIIHISVPAGEARFVEFRVD